MATRITVEPVIDHARGETVFHTLKEKYPKSRLRGVSVVYSYTVDSKLTDSQLKKVADELTNPLIEKSSVGRVRVPTKNASYIAEIGFHPGVTDNVGTTAKKIIEGVLGKKLKTHDAVYTSVFYFFEGVITRKEATSFVTELHNPLIERAHVFSKKEFRPGGRPYVPKVDLHQHVATTKVNLSVPDEELTVIGKQGIENKDGTRRGPLALSLNEMRTIQEYFKNAKRMPTDIELESLAQTWSEHCKHTIFNDPLDDIEEGIYKRYIRGATEKIRKAKGKKDFCGSVFVDNSGSITLNDEYYVTHKVETHNSPSALDPFGGAITGIVGVNRDALGFGLGAKPIANVYGFCVGNPKDSSVLYRDAKQTESLLPAKRILEGVVKGINAGGNQSGIPTPLGFVAVDPRYRGKPLVFAGTVGLIPKKHKGKNLSSKKARPGDYVVMIGGRVGLDGIHGATFSSEALSDGSPATAVQIGDPITQKKLSDALIRDARSALLYSSLTDNGAGGLSCSVAEMAKESGGFTVDLEKVPTKYPGMAPWQIWISESQERMTLAIPKKNWRTFKKIMDMHDVEATVIGEFTKSGQCEVSYKNKKILDISMKFLHDGRKKERQVSEYIERNGTNPPQSLRKDIRKNFISVLSGPNVASWKFIADQYDHEVQGNSVTKPLHGKGMVNAPAAVIKPLASEKAGVVLSNGYIPWYSDLNTYHMAAASVDTAIRNAIVMGADLDHLALLDNFCWSSGNSPERLYELKEAAQACYESAVAYGTPFISGKDSMFNDFKGYSAKGERMHIAVPPTLLISSISVIKDASKTTTTDFKSEGDVVFLLGDTYEELGGSEYVHALSERAKNMYLGERVPTVDYKKNKKLYTAFSKLLNKNLVNAAISVERGGIGTALAKMCVGGDIGASLSLEKIPGKVKESDSVLFSESQGRIIFTTSESNAKLVKAALKGLSCKEIGVVGGSKLNLLLPKKRLSFTLSELTNAYRKPFKNW